MLDIKFIRENSDVIKEAARKKFVELDLDALIALDDKRKTVGQSLEEKRAKQNKASEAIPNSTPEEKARLISEMQPLKEEIQKLEEEMREVMVEWQKLMIAVPNVPDMSVPEGKDDSENVEVKKIGEPTKFTFAPKSHTDLMLALDLVDFERGSKVAGFRGYFLKNAAAQLQFALWQFTNDFFRKKNFVPMIVPSLVKREVFLGTGYIPQGEEDLYKTQDGDYLSGTGEVATMGYYMDEVLDKKDLPKKIIAFSPCFRREAGAHGKDTKGLIRVHEFYKFEQVVLCEASHEESVKLHEEITQNTEELMQALKLPYRIVVNCTGDLGLGQVKKYDTEVWMPSEGKYRETHSSSYFHDFQTRRLNIRYKDTDPSAGSGQAGKLKFAHSLNNTALSGRPLVAIIENYQNEDGSITVPEVLRPYMGGKDRISK